MSVTRISVWLGVSALLVGSVLPTAAQQQAKTATPSGNPPPPSPCAAVTSDGTGTANKVTKFTAPCNIEPSKITDSGTSVSIGELFNLPASGTATATGGKNSQAINFTASAFNSGTATAVNQNFRLQGEPVNNNTTSASGTLNVLFGQGTATPAETGLKIAKTGQLTFAAGQTFPGTARLAGGNAFTGNQSITGNLHATGSISGGSFSGNGSGLTSVNAALLNGFSSGAFAFVGGNNTFTGSNAFTGGFSTTSTFNFFSNPIRFTDDGVGGDLQQPLLVNSSNCCNFGDRMIWAHSPAFPTWGIFYDDNIDVMYWLRDLAGHNAMSINFGTGDLNVTGAITAGTKDFKIDHPLDPKNKYLYHSSVESSEMMNIYTGNATLDNGGEAVISLPKWFEAVNTDFRYQLTAIGASGPGLYVAREIANHQFSIAGGAPGMKVSWQVTGVRHDAYAKTHPLVVEVRKPEKERGSYLHPDAFGEPRLAQEQMLAQRAR
jgi:trimeric autotransporter adhesin